MSGRPCASCSDPRRPELDEAIAAGESFRAIARRFAPLSRDAIRRHRPHVGTALVLAAERREENLGDSLLTTNDVSGALADVLDATTATYRIGVRLQGVDPKMRGLSSGPVFAAILWRAIRSISLAISGCRPFI